MSQKVVDDEGKEIEVFTAEEMQEQLAIREASLKVEHDKIIADKDAHQAEKLKEFEKAKAGAKGAETDAKGAEANALAKTEEATKIANEAKTAIETARTNELAAKKNFWIQGAVAGDPELTKRILEKYDLLSGMPSATDAEIMSRVQESVKLAGINTVVGVGGGNSFSGGFSFGSGGVPPAGVMTDAKIKEHNYEVWKNELGIQDLIPKKPNDQK